MAFLSLHGAVDAFANEMAVIVQRLLRRHGVDHVAIGGGLCANRVGELAVGRASLIVKAADHDVALHPIHHYPDEPGLTGVARLAPSWMLSGRDCVLAIDIGGTNMRAGLVELSLGQAHEPSQIAPNGVADFLPRHPVSSDLLLFSGCRSQFAASGSPEHPRKPCCSHMRREQQWL